MEGLQVQIICNKKPRGEMGGEGESELAVQTSHCEGYE